MISQGVATDTLIIPNVTGEDAGKYYCQVWANNIGVKSKSATLYLSGTVFMYAYLLIICYLMITMLGLKIDGYQWNH